jgi:hypothetical protein
MDALSELRAAYASGVQTGKPIGKFLRIHDINTVMEMEDTVFYANGDVGLSTRIEDESSAKAAHGDRIIADALYVIAVSEQSKADEDQKSEAPYQSYLWRRQERMRKLREKSNIWHEPSKVKPI